MFKWNSAEQEVFGAIKNIIMKYMLLFCPNINKCFDIHTYASDIQISANIIRYGKPIAFYSFKLSEHNKRYMTTGK